MLRRLLMVSVLVLAGCHAPMGSVKAWREGRQPEVDRASVQIVEAVPHDAIYVADVQALGRVDQRPVEEDLRFLAATIGANLCVVVGRGQDTVYTGLLWMPFDAIDAKAYRTR